MTKGRAGPVTAEFLKVSTTHAVASSRIERGTGIASFLSFQLFDLAL